MHKTVTGPIDTSSLPSIYEYKLEGGVTVCDKTNGVGQAVFSAVLAEKYKKPAYEVFINSKKLVYPTCSKPATEPSLLFTGSETIVFKQKDGFIKITEKDGAGKTVLYVDPKKEIDGVAYDVYFYIPKELSQEDALKKIQNIKIDFPNFKGDLAFYNRHGVGVFGWDAAAKKYALCWASPSEERVQMVKCSSCDRYRDGGTSVAKAKNGQVNFRYILHEGSFLRYLNAEPATYLQLI